jgi:hypothetical protein
MKAWGKDLGIIDWLHDFNLTSNTTNEKVTNLSRKACAAPEGNDVM